MTITIVPAINACLNATTTILLIAALIFIKKGNWRAHAYTMSAAVGCSTLFLISYLSYHYIAGERSSGLQHGPLRTFYFCILFPHLILAMVLLPMVAIVLTHAWKRRWIKHKRIASPTLAIWFYVSVSGVAIYWMLYHLFPQIVARGS